MSGYQPFTRYLHANTTLLSSSNAKKPSAATYEPRTEAISPAMNDDLTNADDPYSKSTKDEQTLIVEKLKRVEAEIVQTDLQIVRLRRQKEQLEQAQAAPKHDEDQENVCDTKQLSIAKLIYHENRIKAQKAHGKMESFGGRFNDLPIYNQPSDNVVYHQNIANYSSLFKSSLIKFLKSRKQLVLKLEDTTSQEYDRRMKIWLKKVELEDSHPTKRVNDAKLREFFEKQFPELRKARENGERFSRVGQRVARSDAEVAELLDGITEREDQDLKVKSYAVIPPMLEEMRSKKPNYINTNGYIEDIVAEYKEHQLLNTWTDEEKYIFRENYLQHPKDFGLIARLTSRKNVAHCVQYYYLSKKSENYKQLLKRQQKRRTRSFVRPAATTPANPELVNGVNETTTEQTNQFETKPKFETEQTSTGLKGTCCVCNCENDQFRNVTKFNHQFYGISLDTLKPGMMICYPCRFRHVMQSNLDDDLSTQETNMDLSPSYERKTSMRDIIYQAIEMSFPKQSENLTAPQPSIQAPPIQGPPIAHGPKYLKDAGAADDCILNLSAKSATSPKVMAAPATIVPKQEITQEDDSRSPSEMVIDESADAQSPGCGFGGGNSNNNNNTTTTNSSSNSSKSINNNNSSSSSSSSSNSSSSGNINSNNHSSSNNNNKETDS